MFFLSQIPGRFPVGATTFVTPVRAARAIGSGKLKGQHLSSKSSEPALYLEEVAFTAYYPADISSGRAKKGLDWVIKPVKESLHGFVRFSKLPHWVLWPVIYLFGVLVKIPVYPNTPILKPVKSEGSNLKYNDSTLSQWPLVIFSHGLGGSRTAYSQLCSRLAASGKVVLAIEHRDGTGHACVSQSWQPKGRFKSRSILYYRDGDVAWDDSNKLEGSTPLPLRTDQLEFRRQEFYIAYQAFCRLIQGDPLLELETIDNTKFDRQSWSLVDPISGKGFVYENNVTLAGHSFGGCTVLSILSTEPPQGFTSIPVNNALILDPWLEPLPSPGPKPIRPPEDTSTGSVTSSLDEIAARNDSHRVLVLNSETFTLWKDHYARLQEVISAWEPQGRRIVTLVGSQHASFSDFVVLPLIRKKSAQILMDTISKLSIGFIDGGLKQVLESVSTRKMEIKIIGKRKDGRPKRKLVGNVGDIIVE